MSFPCKGLCSAVKSTVTGSFLKLPIGALIRLTRHRAWLHSNFLQHIKHSGEVNRDWLIPQAANQRPDRLKMLRLIRHRAWLHMDFLQHFKHSGEVTVSGSFLKLQILALNMIRMLGLIRYRARLHPDFLQPFKHSGEVNCDWFIRQTANQQPDLLKMLD